MSPEFTGIHLGGGVLRAQLRHALACGDDRAVVLDAPGGQHVDPHHGEIGDALPGVDQGARGGRPPATENQ